jgi:hypothetical protein
MANFRCEECMVELIADDEGSPELCPRCGQEMVQFLEEESDCTVPQKQEQDRQLQELGKTKYRSLT